MRQIISTAVVAVIVGALAGATMSAVAQTEPAAERAISPAAGINAATVDGKSAVGYTTRKLARRGKLVATNRRGELPSNIVRPLWRLMVGTPATFADGQVGWTEVVGTPAGFADGVDNEGVTGITITRVANVASVSVLANQTGTQDTTCPAGSVVIGGGMNGSNLVVEDSYPSGNGWFVRGNAVEGVNGSFRGWAMCMTVDPAAGITTAKKGKIGPASSE